MKLQTLITLVLISVASTSIYQTVKLQKENDSLKSNQATLLNGIEHYKLADSLNAVKVGELSLSLKEYKKYRAEDAALIKKLKSDKLNAIGSIKTETIIEHVPVHVRDTVYELEKLKAFDYKSKWTDVTGIIKPDSVLLSIANREELLITESFEKKKFLFIKLPAWLFGYKSKKINVVSKNPNTTVTNAEFISIK